MTCVLFAKMDQVLSLKNKTFKEYWKNENKYWKNQVICKSGKVGTMLNLFMI